MFAEILYTIGSLICHQIPERCLESGGRLLPVCARCTGLYLGVFVSAVVFWLLRRCEPADLPNKKLMSLPVVIFCVLGFPLIATDAIAGIIGLYKSPALTRMITGISAGYAFPLFLALANGKHFATKKELVIILLTLAVISAAVYNGFLLFYPASVIILTGFFILWIWIIKTLYALVFLR